MFISIHKNIIAKLETEKDEKKIIGFLRIVNLINSIKKRIYQNQDIRWASYGEYLKSEQWGQLRKSKLKEVNYKCQLCNSNKELNVHHRTYERIFRESIEDLIVLCESCHRKFHKNSDK